MLVVVNHAEKEETTDITVYDPPFVPEYAADLATGGQIYFDYIGELDEEEEGMEDLAPFLSLMVTLDSRCGQIIAFYPRRPVRNKVAVEKTKMKRGEELKYTARLLDADGGVTPGHQVVEIAVIDPDGTIRERYGGSHSTTDGVYTKSVPLALNEAVGEWTIEVFDRLTREKNTAKFKVT